MLGVAIIGCGAISDPHLKAIAAYPEAKLIGVYDIKEPQIEKVLSQYKVRPFQSLQDICNYKEIDIVHILLPHDIHVETAITCLQAGKHVVLEKPVGIDLGSLDRMLEVANKSDKTIGVILQNRFNPTVGAIKAEVEEGKYGAFLGARSTLYWYRDEPYYTGSDWRGIKEREGGGLLINQAIHTLDLMRYIGGEMVALNAKIGNMDHGYNTVEDMAMIEFYYDNGAKGFFFGTNNYHRNEDIRMVFDYEKASFLIEDQTAYRVQGGEKTELAVDQTKEGEKGYWGKGHMDCIHNIYDHICHGDTLKISLQEAILATELVLGAYESDEKGNRYTLKRRY